KGVWVAAKDATQDEIVVAREQRDIYYQEYLKTKDLAINGVVSVLKKLSEKYKMAIVTTSRRVDFDIIHKNRDIVGFMDFVLCVEDYPKAKPHPDPYLMALDKFGATKEQAIIVEDSQRGLISANRAKIESVIVFNQFTQTQDFSTADHHIKKIDNLCDILL
ncbi:MAG: HAD-IA family hydrolase, partial [Campylobacterota bacterium]|nr:HAD-IA family hydrolase [Campylobacterota bacterium]